MVKRQLRKFIREDSGQSMTEYILILSVVVLIVVRFRKTIMEKILGATDKVGKSIDDALEE